TKDGLAQMPRALKLAVWGAGSMGEGAIFGTTAGAGGSIARGDSPDQVVQNALWGGAFGMVLNPLGESALRGLGAAGRKALGKEVPGVLDFAIPKPKAPAEVAAPATGGEGGAGTGTPRPALDTPEGQAALKDRS